jgi:hypothetical protein
MPARSLSNLKNRSEIQPNEDGFGRLGPAIVELMPQKVADVPVRVANPESVTNPRPHRAQLDIAHVRQDIVIFLRQARTKPPHPKRPATPVSPVEILHIALPHRLHQPPGAIRRIRRNQQMHMIRHQHIGMDVAAVLSRILTQPKAVKLEILRRGKANLRLLPRWMIWTGTPARQIRGRRGMFCVRIYLKQRSIRHVRGCGHIAP